MEIGTIFLMPWVYSILVYVKTIQYILGVAQQEKLSDIPDVIRTHNLST